MNRSYDPMAATLDVDAMNRRIDGLFDFYFHTPAYRDKFMEIARGTNLAANLRKLADALEQEECQKERVA